MHQRIAPRGLILVERLEEEAVEQQILDPRVFVECFFDLAQKAAANDASAALHQRDAAHVQVPAVLFCGGPEQHVALRIRDDL